MIPKEIYENRNFTIKLPNIKRHQFMVEEGISVFTDGSVLDGKKVGCGIHIMIPNEGTYDVSYCMNDYASIFQAELTALKMAAELLLQEERREEIINLYSDSLSSIQALNSLIINSTAVKECLKNLNRLGNNNVVKVSWVKAHEGTIGNEKADTLAKQGAVSEAGEIIEILPPLSKQKKAIREFYYDKWTKEFKRNKQAKQTKLFFPQPNQKRAHELINRSRSELSLLVKTVSGHNFLRKHRFLQNLCFLKKCRLCNFEEESSLHILFFCPAFEVKRISTFNNKELDNIAKVKFDKLQNFIKVTRIGNMISELEN